MKKAIIILLIVSFWGSVSNAATSRQVKKATGNNTRLAMTYGDNKPKGAATPELLKSYLKLTSFKHKVLSQNLANVNTPGYKADDVAMPQTIDELRGNSSTRSRRIALAVTSSKHLAGNKDSGGEFASEKLKDPFEIKPNGNNVSLAQQVMKISQNQTAYNTAMQIYNGNHNLATSILGK